MQPIIEFKHISKAYGSFYALKDIDLSIEGEKIIGLLGPNGSGKSTMLKLINGLIQPTQGSVLIDGHKPSSLAAQNMISFLPENSYLNDWMKVKDLVQFFTDFYLDFDRQKALHMIQDLKLEMNQPLKTMSKGTKEKVQLVLVMSRKAKLYLLDEPIGGVDPASRDYILDTIISNYLDDATLIISTHLISDIERIFDDVIFIKEGHIERHGNVDDIRQNTGKSIDGLFREVFAYAR